MVKKIIITVPYLSGKGGTESVIKNFYEAVLSAKFKEKIEWKLISFGGSKTYEWMAKWPKKIYHFTNNRLIQDINYAFRMPTLIKEVIMKEKPDYLVATNPFIWSIAYDQCHKRKIKTKIIAWYHYSYIKKKVKRKYLRKADIFWAISSGIKDELIYYGINPSKIDLIYNPIDLNDMHLLKRSNRKNHFIYVGRMDYNKQKNLSELFKALALVKGSFVCDFYGTISTTTKRKLIKLIPNTLKGKIWFHGFSSDVWKNIRVADVLLLTSKYEGFPMVLCEAASHGIALLSSNCPTGVKDIINKENGWLYTVGNYYELAHIIDAIILGNKELPNSRYVQNSIKKFDYEHYIKRVYKSLVM